MSSYDELAYFFESSGFDHGVHILLLSIILISLAIGGLLGKCMIEVSAEDEERKAARRALAKAFNEESGLK